MLLLAVRLTVVMHLRAAHATGGLTEPAVDVLRRRTLEGVGGRSRRRVRILVDNGSRVGCGREGLYVVVDAVHGRGLASGGFALAEDV